MELAPQLGDHFTAWSFLPDCPRLVQQGFQIFAPTILDIASCRYEGHVRINRHVLLEFRTSFTPQEDHECCVTWGVNEVTNCFIQWTLRGAQSTVAICIWRITFCCSLTRERSSRTWFHAASVSVVLPEEAHAPRCQKAQCHRHGCAEKVTPDASAEE